jgi:hypothetical protein
MQVDSPRALGAFFSIKLDFLAFIQNVKLNIYERTLVKEYLIAVCVIDETKTSFADYLLYCAFMHFIPPLKIWARA